MADIKMVPVKCPHCGAQMQIEEGRKEAFCTYCGSKFLIDDGEEADQINITNNIHNESHTINNYASRGVVGSVLDFVDKQKDRQEQQDREARERAERARQQGAENAKKFMTFARQHWKITLGVIVALLLIMIVSPIIRNARQASAERAHIEAGEIKTGNSSSSFYGQDYKDVIKQLQSAGFTNIEEQTMDDVIFGFLTKEGAVERVSIDGNTSFSSEDWYPTNAPVVVTYHTAYGSESGESTATAETEAVSADSAREERDAFYENSTYKTAVGLYEFTLPDYWVQSRDIKDSFRAYAETNRKVAMMDIRSDVDNSDPVGFDWLDEQYERDLTIQALFTSLSAGNASDLTKLSEEIVETEDYKGVLWKIAGKYTGIPMKGQLLMFPSEDDNSWVTVELFVTDNTMYGYDNDFAKILHGIKKRSAEDIAAEAAMKESEAAAKQAKLDAEQAAKQAAQEKFDALDAEFPQATAKKVLDVAFTNFEAEDVFKSDGNTIDMSKLHDSEYSGEFAKAFTTAGKWTPNDDGTWHVENAKMRNVDPLLYTHMIKFTCDVAYDGSYYYVKNVRYITASEEYIDTEDPSKTSGWSTIQEQSSYYNAIFKVSPSLIK